MSSGKAQWYIWYALGEIGLVVIGILIALQINNWNEGRKDAHEERKLLIEIRNTLKKDLSSQIMPKLAQVTRRSNDVDDILKHIDDQLGYHDSLNSKTHVLTRNIAFEPNLISYKNLESKGIDFIKSDSIKLMILEVYNSGYPRIQGMVNNYRHNIQEYGRPIIRNQFEYRIVDDIITYRPLDFGALSRTPLLRNTLMTIKLNLRNLSEVLLYSERQVVKLIGLIDAEIGDAGQ